MKPAALSTTLGLVALATLLAAARPQAALTAQPAVTAPSMAALDRFASPDIPEMGPAEIAVPPRHTSADVPPADLPGHGLSQHPMLYIGEGCNRIFVINHGKVVWSYSTGPGNELDDAWMLSNGNVLYSRMQYVAEVTPQKQVVWRFNAPAQAEIHCCQPIGTDKVLFIENGLPPKLMVVDIKTGAATVQHDLPFLQPPDPKKIHPQFRRVRYTAQGTYLIPFLNMSNVVEYDRNFNQIWSYPIRTPWAAIRLKNGNTLITDEAGQLTREVNQKGETVWEFKATDLPGNLRFASAPQTCTRLANGNTIFCSRGNNGKGPQLVEVTPDKKVVWVLWDFKTLGPATGVQILDDPGIPEIPGESDH